VTWLKSAFLDRPGSPDASIGLPRGHRKLILTAWPSSNRLRPLILGRDRLGGVQAAQRPPRRRVASRIGLCEPAWQLPAAPRNARRQQGGPREGRAQAGAGGLELCPAVLALRPARGGPSAEPRSHPLGEIGGVG
jgi:hypothetical protein